MELVQFYSTLVIQLVSVLAGATCLSVYIVSRRRTFLYAFWAFLFYFFDVTLVFQDGFVAATMDIADEGLYLAIRSAASVVSGAGVFISLWLLACDFVGEKRRALIVVPGVVFVAGSVGFIIATNVMPYDRFAFYTMRTVFFFWTLAYLGIQALKTTDKAELERLRRFRPLYIALWIGGIGVFLEDVYCFVIAPSGVDPLSLFSAERNYIEEILMVVCAVAACSSAYRALSLRYEKPPVRENERVEQTIDANIDLYSTRHKLSKREQEVLRFVLLGLDNQNIASTMSVAPGTVKVHVHNILRKTGQTNRQDLIQDFWKTW